LYPGRTRCNLPHGSLLVVTDLHPGATRCNHTFSCIDTCTLLHSGRSRCKCFRGSARSGIVDGWWGNASSTTHRMLRMSRSKFLPATVGDNVTIPVPDVDRGRGDPRNILCVVLEVTDEQLYRVGNKEGVLETLLSRNMFSVTRERFLVVEDVPREQSLKLRRMATLQSATGGQGYSRCNCKQGCKTDRYGCRRAGLNCNSKCHNSSSCTNKGPLVPPKPASRQKKKPQSNS